MRERLRYPPSDTGVSADLRTSAWNVHTAVLDDVRADVELLDRITFHDEHAVTELYNRHSGPLFSLVLRILRDRSEAEEIVQEVFVLIWTRAETYRADLGSPSAWLMRIGRNRGIDRLRMNTVRVRAVESAPLPVAPVSPETRLAQLQRHRAIVHALESLPERQRWLIEQAYFRGLTHAELADQFQLPLGTVKTRIRRGMTTLRLELRDHRCGVAETVGDARAGEATVRPGPPAR